MIVLHPKSENVALGEKCVTFRCEAVGTPPLHYSWMFNGRHVTGETGNTLTINVRKQMAGRYQCCVQNKFDYVASNPAELRIGRFIGMFAQ